MLPAVVYQLMSVVLSVCLPDLVLVTGLLTSETDDDTPMVAVSLSIKNIGLFTFKYEIDYI